MDVKAYRSLSQSLRERIDFIDFRLMFLGRVYRPDLVGRFGIAPAVATRDLASYREIAPSNIVFNGRLKQYEPSDKFKPIAEHDVERVLSALSRGYDEASGGTTGYLPCEFPMRLNQPELSVLSVIGRAIHQKRTVKLTYNSLSSGPSSRVIVPFALVDSGLRWHTRCYDRKSKEFRDLVLTRMSKPILQDDTVAPTETADNDHQWTRFVSLELVVHPAQARPEIVSKDFGMKNGSLSVNVRAAVCGYVLQQWGVDCSSDHSLNPSVHRLWLTDAPKVLHGVSNAVLAAGYGT
jgi:hypothetical protein